MTTPRVRERIASGVKYIALEKILIQALSIVSFVIVINNISLKDFGLVNLLFTFVSVATTLVLLGAERLIVAEAAMLRAREAYAKLTRMLTEYAVLGVVLLFALFLSSWFLIDVADNFYDANLHVYYAILVGLIIGQAGLNYANVAFESFERFDLIFWTNFSETVLRVCLIASLYLVFGFTLQTVLWSYVIAKVVAFFGSIPKIIRLSATGTQGDGGESMLLGMFKKHGKWEVASAFFSTATSNVWPWIINSFVSIEGVALYAFVQKINSVIVKVLPVRDALFPILIHSIEKSRHLAGVIMTKAKKYLFLFYLVVYALSFVFFGMFIALFMPQYADAEGLIKLSMLRLFIDVFSLGQMPVFYALRKQKLVFYWGIVVSVLMVFTQVLFTYWWGLTGMVSSVLFVTAVNAVCREYLLTVRYNFPVFRPRELFTFDAYDKVVIERLLKKFTRTAPQQ